MQAGARAALRLNAYAVKCATVGGGVGALVPLHYCMS